MRAAIHSPSLVALLLLTLPALGTTVGLRDEPQTTGNDYQAGDYGRVRDAENGLSIVRAQWNHEQGVLDEGLVNSPIFPGDKAGTSENQRAEIQLAGGSLVWIDSETALTFLALPDPYAQVADNTVLQLGHGRIRVSASLVADEELRVDTPAASIYPLADAELRIEVGSHGHTRVYSRRGVVEVVGNGGSVLVRGGTFADVDPDSLPYDPEPFNTLGGDRFDGYVAQREQLFEYRDGNAGGEVYGELPSEIQPYYRELSVNGNWSRVDEQGYVWQPTGVTSDWRPYDNGYWGYGPEGYFWISNEPWGWAPYHYGRWTWIGGRGWCWSPGRVFAGAWVSWSWGSAYVGWSPLDYWGYPSYRYHRHYGYYDPYCWSFVSYRHFHHRHNHLYRVAWDHVQHDVHGAAVVTRPPRVPPNRLADSPVARDRAAAAARSDTRHRVARSEAGRPNGRSFRTTENELIRGGRGKRAGAETPVVPNGRARTVPTASRFRSERRPESRSGSLRGDDTAKRERVPVTTQPRYRRSLTRTGDDRSPAPSAGERSGATRSRSRPEGARGDDTTSGTSGRVRDLYRKMSRPRETREQPKTTQPSRSTPTRTSRPTKATTPKPQTPKARPQPKPRETGKASRGTSRPQKPKRNDLRSAPTRSGSGSRSVRPPSRSGSTSKPTARPGRSRSGGGRKKSR